MEQHKILTGLPYDPVIVFPQGLFSSVAMKALRDCGYFAAFNTTTAAVDADAEESLGIQYQGPATMIYHNFPLFLRRYPKEKAYFADDLRTGRPIIIVEHHGAFRHGYKYITDLVDWINSMGNMKWVSLLNIAEYYLGKRATSATQMGQQFPSQPVSGWKLVLNTRTLLRRWLSEFRDNYVQSNNILSKVYEMLWR